MDWKLELVAIPVSDVDRAKALYVEDGNGWSVQDLPARPNQASSNGTRRLGQRS